HQISQAVLVDLRDANVRGLAARLSVQLLQIALTAQREGFERDTFVVQLKAAAHKGLDRARVTAVNLGDQPLGPHLEEGQLHALAQSAGSELAAPVVTVANDQHDLAVRARLDQAHKAHRCIVAVVGHEETPALIEQMGQYRQLHAANDLLDKAGDVARIAQVAGDVGVLQDRKSEV